MNFCLYHERKAIRGLPDAEFLESKEAVLEQIALQGTCILFLMRSDAEREFIGQIRACNPACRVIVMLEDAQAGMVIPYAWKGELDGLLFLHDRAEDCCRPAAEMFKDVLSMEYIHDLIYGHLERLEQLQPMFSIMEFDINPQIILTVIYDDFWTICEQHHNSYRYRLKRLLLNKARAFLEKEIKGIASTLIGTDKVVVALDCGERKGKAAEAYAEECAGLLRDYLIQETNYSVSIGVSSFCDTAGFLWRAYEQSFRALEHSFQKGRGQILHYMKSIPIYGNEGILESEQISHDLIAAVTMKNEAYGAGVLERFLDLALNRNMGASYVKSLSVTILSELSQYCIRIGLDSASVSGKLIQTADTIFKDTTIADMIGAMQSFLHFVLEQVIALADNGRAMDIAKAYIQQFYMLELDLEQVASVCGYSTSYFSRSFRKCFGINFVQYLLQVRLDSARQLLKNSRLSIADISERTGFQSLSYFSTIFKRETGTSPNQFRLKHQEGKP